MPVLGGDSRAAWDHSVLDDPRVTNLWDGRQLFGTWLQAHGGAFWDAYLVYRPDTRWLDEPRGEISTGSPIIGATSSLERSLLPLLR
jgi:hypothetical protein